MAKVFTMVFMVMLVFSALSAISVSVNAATDVTTSALLTITPNPGAVNTRLTIILTISPPPPNSQVFQGLQFTITNPDGTVQTHGPFTSSIAGTTTTYFTPAMVGTYTFLLRFLVNYFQMATTTCQAIPDR